MLLVTFAPSTLIPYSIGKLYILFAIRGHVSIKSAALAEMSSTLAMQPKFLQSRSELGLIAVGFSGGQV